MTLIDRIAFTFGDPAIAVSVAIGIAFFVAVVTFVMPAFVTDRLEARMKAAVAQREELRRRSRAALVKNEQRGLRRTSSGFMSDTVKSLNLQSLLEDPNVEKKLLQAGFRGPGPLATFYFFRFSLPFVGAALGLVYVLFLGGKDFQLVQKIGVVVAGLAAGFYLPNLYVTNLAAKRLQSIISVFPDALDMMLICVESGMSAELALGRVAAEIGTGSVALAEELTMTNAELSYLPDRRQAWENLTQRVNHPGVRSVALAMMQSERYGTPISTALRTLAKENRELRMTSAEKKAAALPAQLTVPMIVFFLPVLFLVIGGPAYIRFKQHDDKVHHDNQSSATIGSSRAQSGDRAAAPSASFSGGARKSASSSVPRPAPPSAAGSSGTVSDAP